tara:strand:+ start:9158 stop:9472 length:315 start_codon:yes stop_codon:yes gene_type:complete
MESEQKYIEDEFELDENFLYQIHAFNPSVKNKIAAQIDTLIGLPATKGLDKLKSGVVHDKDGTPTFFTLSYSKRNKNSPSILLDIFEITLDQYLNDINLNIHIK